MTILPLYLLNLEIKVNKTLSFQTDLCTQFLKLSSLIFLVSWWAIGHLNVSRKALANNTKLIVPEVLRDASTRLQGLHNSHIKTRVL